MKALFLVVVCLLAGKSASGTLGRNPHPQPSLTGT